MLLHGGDFPTLEVPSKGAIEVIEGYVGFRV